MTLLLRDLWNRSREKVHEAYTSLHGLWQSDAGGKARAHRVLDLTQLEDRILLSASPAGAEMLVNTETTAVQDAPAVAMDADGDYVAVWVSDGQDGSSGGIYAQRYSGDGTAQGSEFLVNSTTTGDQSEPAVAMDDAGNFVVVWSSSGQDGSGWGIYAQQFNADGTASGSEFLVNSTTSNDQIEPAVAMDSNGDFVVTWSSNLQDGSGYGIYGQRYDSTGTAQGSEFLINSDTTNDQHYSDVAMDDAGDFVVTWSSDYGGNYGVRAQRYDSSGTAQGSQIQVNTETSDDQMYSSVGMDSTGNFAIAWQSNNQDGSGEGIYAQQFDSSGSTQGSEFRVNSTTSNDQTSADVAMSSTGDFVVTWTSMSQDGSSEGVYLQQYDSAGNAVYDEMQVNTTTSGSQLDSSVAIDDNGNFVVLWQGNGTGDSTGVFGQRFEQIQPVMWVSTYDDVNSSGSTTLDSWTDGEALGFGDPSLAFDPGATDGSFESIFNLDNFGDGDVDLDGIHYVTSDITVGTTNSIDLLTGDVLFTTRDNESLTSNNSLSFEDGDLIVFRPDTPGDYSSGTFIHLLDNMNAIGGGNDIWAITLVEQATLVGDVTLAAGTFLFSRDGGEEDNNIYYFTADNVGAGTTTGTVSVLIEGDDIGIGSKIHALDLVEQTISIGGETLTTGTILVSLDADENVGDNSISVTRQDIFALDVTQTTLISGTAAADATRFFDGSDVGLGNSAESIDAFTLMDNNSPPEATADAYSVDEGATINVNVASGVLANDTDINDDTLTVSLVSGPSNAGSFTLNADGSFSYTHDGSETINDSFTYQVSDGRGGLDTGTVTLTINPVNDAAALDLDADNSSGATGADFTASFTEDGGAVAIADADASLSDVDNTNFSSLTVTITNLLDGTAESLVANTTGTSITASYNSATGVLTLSGSDTVANYQQVLRTITYDNSAQDPDTTTRSITFVANDGTDNSNIGTTTVTMTAVNDAAILDLDADNSSGETGADYTTTFTEDGGAVAITDADATLSDIDSTNLTSLTVAITNLLDGTAESLTADTTGTNITASYNSATGELTFSGSDSVANYQQVLHTITYNNTSQDLDTTTRSITFVANDGTDNSNIGTTTVSMTAVNDAVVLDLDADNSSGASSADYATSFIEDGGAVTIADTDATLSDVDSTTLSSLTVTITNALDGGQESLTANTTGTSISLSYNAGSHTLTLSGADSVANYQQVLRTITYNNTAQNIDTTARSITFVANDGTADSNLGTTTVSIFSLDDAPVLDLDANDSSGQSGADFAVTFTEDGGSVAIADADATLSDVDSSTFSSMTVTITNLLDGTAESLTANTTGTSITASYNSATGVLTLSGSDTIVNYQQVLRTITYDNTSQNPDTTARSITFVTNDGTLDSNIGTTTVTMTAVNDASVLDLDADDSSGQAGADFTSSFTEDGGAVLIVDADATLSDIDDTNLSSMTVTITNLFDGTAESLAANTTGTSITASYNSATGVLTLSGSDSIANYQQVLRTITYDNSAQNLDTTARSITFVANDGTDDSNIGTTTVSMTAVNDAAVLDLDANNSSGQVGADYATTFTEDGGAVTLADTDASLSDVDSANLSSMTVTITNLLDGTAESLSANTTGTSITASYNSATGVLTLSGADTVSNYEQVLQTITYNNTSQNPNTTARSITFVANDGVADSNLATTTLSVVAVNDAPINSVPGGQTVNEDATLTFSSGDGNAITISDVDEAGGTMEVTLTATSGTMTLGGFVGLTFTGGDGTSDTTMTFSGTAVDINAALEGMTFTPTADFNGAAGVQISTNDLGNTGTGGAKSDTDSIAITVNAVNDTSIAANDSYNVDEDVTLNVAVGPGVLANDTDIDGDLLTAVLVSGPSNGSLTLNADGSFSYTPNTNFNGVDSFTYRANDGSVNSNLATVSITVNPINDTPTGNNDSYSTDTGSTLNVAAGGVLANDVDIDGDLLAAALVSGPANGSLTLNADGSFSYTPTGGFFGTDSFSYRANDGSVNSNVVTVMITVNVVADPAPPVSEEPIDETPPEEEAPSDPTMEDTITILPSDLIGNIVTNNEEQTLRFDSNDETGNAPAMPVEFEIQAFDTSPSISSGNLEDDRFSSDRGTQYWGGSSSIQNSVTLPAYMTSVENFDQVANAGLLWDKLDSLKEDLGTDSTLGTLTVGSATAVTTALSVGYVLWTIRGGYLMASMLSTMPAWRMIDPLPILDGLGDDGNRKKSDDEDDKESLLSMVENE